MMGLDLQAFTEVVVDSTPVVGDPSPYPTQEIGAALIEPGVDEYYRKEAYIWCRLVQTDGDLEFEAGAAEFVGDVPDWWETIHETGIGWLIGAEQGGWDYPRVLDWALREGLAPEQEFLVCVPEPTWYKCSYEYDEWDYECDLFIVRRLPVEVSVRKFEQIVSEVFADRRAREGAHEDLRRAQWADTERMYLHSEGYWSSGYNECSPPGGIMVRLLTTRGSLDKSYRGHGFLAEGRDDGGDHTKALDKLKAKVADRLTGEFIDGLKRWR